MLFIELSLIALVAAILPLYIFYKKYRNSSIDYKFLYFTLLLCFLTFDLIIFGAFTRLTDSGLGCPDWPGCFASSNPFSAINHITLAYEKMPTGAVSKLKAWIEMTHRYFAMVIGILAIILNYIAFRYKNSIQIKPIYSLAILALIIIQGIFGAFTVTLKLQPIIVTIHLILAIILLCSLVMLFTKQLNIINKVQTYVIQGNSRILTFLSLFLLAIQIVLGAWVSSNYAVLGCNEFPSCINGEYLPKADFYQGFSIWRDLGFNKNGDILSFASLTAIHLVHRYMAIVVFFIFLINLITLIRKLNLPNINFQTQKVIKLSKILIVILTLQVFTGIANVVLDWPILSALIHTGGAAYMISGLIYILSLKREA